MTLYIKICEAGWRLIELENIAFYVKTETIKLVGVFGTLIALMSGHDNCFHLTSNMKPKHILFGLFVGFDYLQWCDTILSIHPLFETY